MQNDQTDRNQNDRIRYNPVEAQAVASELNTLLTPLSPEVFLQNYWQKQSLCLKGTPDKFRPLFDQERFLQAIAQIPSLTQIQSLRLHAMIPTVESVLVKSSMSMEPIEPDEIEDLFAQGITICVNDIGAADNNLAAFARNIKRQLAFTGTVRFNCYYSPPYSGADMHFDARASTTLQIEGRKRWMYAVGPSIHWPLSNAQHGTDGKIKWAHPGVGHATWEQMPPISEVEFVEVVLEPGDILYLPAGTWHDAKATDVGSLALNLSFGPTSFSNLLIRLLDGALLDKAEWRSGPPPVVVQELLEDHMPAAVEAYIQMRIEELREFLNSLDLRDPRVIELWRQFVLR